MDKAIYNHDDYRVILKDTLKARKGAFGREYTFEKMAQACRVQRTYLSTVLGGNGHLNGDQLFLACEFLAIPNDGYEYIRHLHEFAKSQCKKRRERIGATINTIRGKQLETSTHLRQVESNRTERLEAFYLDFNAQLIHMFLCIKEFREDLSLLQRKVRLDGERFNKSLLTIEKAGLIAIEGRAIKLISDSIHLPPSSPFYDTYRTQMRLRGLERMQTSKQDTQYSFSVLFSADEKTRQTIQKKFLELISEAQDNVESSSGQGVYQINFDLFQW